MSDYKPERLSKLAREFNSSVSSLAEYLNKNGITIDANPNTKIDAEGYQVLAKHFAPDKQLREAAEKRALDRPVKEPIKEVVKEKPPVVEEKPAEKEIVKPVAEEKIAKEVPIIESKEEKSEEVKPAAKKTKEKKETKEVEEVVEIAEEKVTEKSEPTVIEGKAKIGGLKIKGKIELEEKPKRKTKKQLEEEAAAQKAEAKKSSKKKKETPVEPEEVAVEEVKKEEQKLQEVPPEVVAPVVETSTPVEPEIIKPKFEKLAGLNVIGKMELPVNDPNKNKDKDKDKEAEKKKRKRKTNNYVGGSDSKTFKTDPNNDRRPDPNRPIVPANRRPIPGGGDRNKPKRDNAEITDKEIQDKIKETLSRLSAGTGLTSNRSKLRRQKRDSHAADHEEKMAQMDLEAKTLKVTEFVSANDLANMMDVAVTEVITACMSLGMMVSINQRLDAETISIVAEEFGYKVSFVEVDGQDDFVEPEDDPADLVERAPIVTVMGHVDHGKTTLLDFIRNANVAGGEAGGITQHLGAYEVKLENGKKITFLDTPGHEAFTAMRARGAKLTDIVIIVVAADDSVMPQTKEAIAHAQAAGVPIVIAINKIDKEGAAPDRVREQLSQLNVLVEEWGGKVQSQEISAKKGINIDKLLEKVLLEAEYLNLKANPKKAAIGTVVEASLEKGRGTVTTMMVQAGTLNKGDTIVAGQHYAKIRAMFNEWGKNIESAGPSTPVKVLGFTGAPQAGDVFKVFADESMAKEISIKRQQLLREQTIRTQKHITLDEIGRRLAIGNFKELKLIVKGDVDGSVQALTDSFLKLTTPEISVNVIMRGVGAISESDVLLASASDAVIIGFNVRPSLQAKKLAETEGIDIHFYSIIYDAINEVKAAMEGMLAPTVEEKIVCNVEIREVFEISKVGTIAGCMVRDGKIERKTKIRIIRDGVVIHTGELASLKRFKDDVKEVSTGYECGLSINNFNNIQVGDIVEGYELVEKKRTL